MKRDRDRERNLDRQCTPEEIKALWAEVRKEKQDDPETLGALLAHSLKDDPAQSPPPNFANAVMSRVEKAPAPGRLTSEQKLASFLYPTGVLTLAMVLATGHATWVKWMSQGYAFETSLDPIKNVLAGLMEGLRLVFLVAVEMGKATLNSTSAAWTLALLILFALLTVVSLSKPSVQKQ